VLRSHQKVVTASGDGEVTSGTFSPTLGSRRDGARAREVKIGDTVQVDIRASCCGAGRQDAFVRNGKALI